MKAVLIRNPHSTLILKRVWAKLPGNIVRANIDFMKGSKQIDANRESTLRASGGCLCAAVKYEIHGPLYNVINCHCSKCRRIHGHTAAYASTKKGDLKLVEQRGLKWYRSIKDETPEVNRGFCKECGGSLFWEARDDIHIYISAGTLDKPTGLKTIGHIWMNQAGDYYELTDNLKKYDEDSNGKIVANAD
jgi:hypothetical protein